jgi:hypothetical protein
LNTCLHHTAPTKNGLNIDKPTWHGHAGKPISTNPSNLGIKIKLHTWARVIFERALGKIATLPPAQVLASLAPFILGTSAKKKIQKSLE